MALTRRQKREAIFQAELAALRADHEANVNAAAAPVDVLTPTTPPSQVPLSTSPTAPPPTATTPTSTLPQEARERSRLECPRAYLGLGKCDSNLLCGLSLTQPKS